MGTFTMDGAHFHKSGWVRRVDPISHLIEINLEKITKVMIYEVNI